MKAKHTLLSCLTALCLLLCAGAAFGQTTTGSISGLVVAQEDGSALPGAIVEAVHVPTGTRYSTVTNAEGRFRVFGVRVGGPYHVSVQMDGFRNADQSELFVKLGEDLFLTFQLVLDTVSETLLVTAESTPLINPSKTGASSNVPTEAIERLPTVQRNLNDFARTNPFFVVAAENEDPDAVSIAGRSGRYNNITIDGSVNNDLFGLADTGTPGGQAGTTPISLDAIQEVELVLSDFDVRTGGFSSGSINAITRNGTNELKGSVFYYTRDDSYFGDGPDTLGEFGQFEEDQYGFRLGGPIQQDKIFFFVNADLEERTTPTGWSIDGSTGQQFGVTEDDPDGLVAEAQLFRQTLIDRYGFDPGGLGENSRDNPSDKIFARLDFNLADTHNLTLRHNFVDAGLDVNRPGSDTYEWPSETYDFQSETNSTVAQLNSSFGSNFFNEARVSYQTIKDRRQGRNGLQFPWIEVEEVDAAGDFEFEAGTEPFSTANALDQEIIELHNDLTWLNGNHTITLGTHNELFTFDNLFVQNFFGAYEFGTLQDFLDGDVRRYRHTFPNPGQSPVASFDVNQIGLYAGDQWTAAPNLTLTFGLRADIPFLPDEPEFNPVVQDLFGFDTSELPDGEVLWQPRFGFNWDPESNGESQVRGGLGVFAGRSPYVWIANQYGRNGLVFTDIQVTGDDVPDFVPDPFNPPRDFPGLNQEVNLIDPGFKFPTVMRYNLAYDRQLPFWDLVFSAEVVHTDSLEEIDYKNLNIRQTGDLTFDGRPLYEEVSRDFVGAYLITNSSEGEATNFAVKLERPFREGLWGYVSYAYGDSETINDGSSSRAVSNWQFNETTDPNNVQPSTSDFEVEHRFNVSVSYQFNRATKYPTTVSLFYNLQSGRPFTWLMDSDFVTFGFGDSFNGDGAGFNDLAWVPATESDVVITNGTWEELDAFISQHPSLDNARGSIVDCNNAQAPWHHTLDLHVAQDIEIRGTRLQITLDVLNLANLFDDDSGVLRFAEFNTVTPWELEGFTEDGTPMISLENPITGGGSFFDVHNTRSRWRAKLGVRWTF